MFNKRCGVCERIYGRPDFIDFFSVPVTRLFTYLSVVVGSTEAPLIKVFLLFSLFFDWLNSNHLKSRIERDFLDIFCAIFVAL